MPKLDLFSILDFPKNTPDTTKLSESLRVLGILETRVKKSFDSVQVQETLSLLRQRFAATPRDTSPPPDGVAQRLDSTQSKL